MYFGTEDLRERIETTIDEARDAEGDGSNTLDQVAISKHISATELSINLYILADKLLDPITANSVIDELITYSYKQGWTINSRIIAHIYACSIDGSQLRKLTRDWYIHDNDRSWATKMSEAEWALLPPEFTRDLIIETMRLQEAHPIKRIDQVFDDYPEGRKKGFYHQKVEQKLEAS